jgi:glycine betaine/proline transport system permease protein
VSLGLVGLWQESMDTLALTLAAVLLCLAIGIPAGVWIGLSERARRVATPVLDVLQAMPTFVYLAPLALFFLIGPAAAVITTLLLALPPVIRLTAHGIAGVDDSALEASRSLTRTPWPRTSPTRCPMTTPPRSGPTPTRPRSTPGSRRPEA